MEVKTVVADLTKGENLDGDNYDMSCCKIQYLLNEQEVLNTLEQVMVKPEQGNTTQYRCDLEVYQTQSKKDQCALFTMLSSMHNDLISEFEHCRTAFEIWEALKKKFGVTSLAKLCD